MDIEGDGPRILAAAHACCHDFSFVATTSDRDQIVRPVAGECGLTIEYDEFDRLAKEEHMKSTRKIALFALGLVVLLGLAGASFRPLPKFEALVQAASENVLKFDVACDCRTFVGGPNRGDVFIIQGKLFPAGTLPSGTATNDPTQPVNGVAPIGDWICRGQNSFPFPPAIAPAYRSTPPFFNTQYFILNEGRALTAEGYAIQPEGELLSVTGGIGRFSGASGFIEEAPFATNATGCPNFRAKFKGRIRSSESGDHD